MAQPPQHSLPSIPQSKVNPSSSQFSNGAVSPEKPDRRFPQVVARTGIAIDPSPCECDPLGQWKVESCDDENSAIIQSGIISTHRPYIYSYFTRDHAFHSDDTRSYRSGSSSHMVLSSILATRSDKLPMRYLPSHLQSKTTMMVSYQIPTITLSVVEFLWVYGTHSSQTKDERCWTWSGDAPMSKFLVH